jgi:hypothetical protein
MQACIRKVTGSNLAPNTGHPDREFRVKFRDLAMADSFQILSNSPVTLS